MDDKYKGVYGSLYDTFQSEIPLYLQPHAAKVRAAIDDAAAQLQTTVREDAKYLLLINFVEIVYRPILQTPTMPTGVSPDQLDQIVKDDIKTLVQESAKSQTPGPVSAHAVLSTIGTVWDKLKTGTTKIWEGS